MRTYPTNSPEAAARIVVLAALSDGHLSKAELDSLISHRMADALELPLGAMQRIIHEVCDDLLGGHPQGWEQARQIAPSTLAALLGEIQSAALRDIVLDLCGHTIAADRTICRSELGFLNATLNQWDGAGASARAPSPH